MRLAKPRLARPKLQPACRPRADRACRRSPRIFWKQHDTNPRPRPRLTPAAQAHRPAHRMRAAPPRSRRHAVRTLAPARRTARTAALFAAPAAAPPARDAHHGPAPRLRDARPAPPPGSGVRFPLPRPPRARNAPRPEPKARTALRAATACADERDASGAARDSHRNRWPQSGASAQRSSPAREGPKALGSVSRDKPKARAARRDRRPHRAARAKTQTNHDARPTARSSARPCALR